MKTKVVVIRPLRSEIGFPAQVDVLRDEAYECLQQVVEIKADSLKLVTSSDGAQVNLGSPTDPYIISLWQMNLVGAIFEAEGEPIVKGRTPLVTKKIDHDKREYTIVEVE